MKVLCCGDRYWSNFKVIKDRLRLLPKTTIIIEGEARGADTLSRIAAWELLLDVVKVPAEWDKYGRAAGPIRNKKMIDMKPDLFIAFHNNVTESRGTANTLMLAEEAGIPTELITA